MQSTEIWELETIEKDKGYVEILKYKFIYKFLLHLEIWSCFWK